MLKLTILGAALAALGMSAVAQTAPQAAPPAETGLAPSAPAGLQGRRAVRDKVTGQLREPTEAELIEMEEAARADRARRGLPEVAGPAQPLRMQVHPNGMRSAVLGTEYLVTLTGKRRADGSVERAHAHGDHAHPVARDLRPKE